MFLLEQQARDRGWYGYDDSACVQCKARREEAARKKKAEEEEARIRKQQQEEEAARKKKVEVFFWAVTTGLCLIHTDFGHNRA